MKYRFLIFGFCIAFLFGCDEDSNMIDPEPEPRSCFTTQEVAQSECPAELLTNMCVTYTCNFINGNIAGDGPFPPCPGDPITCDFVDCSTLTCGGSIRYDISVSEGGLGYSFDAIDPTTGEPNEVRVTCFEEGFLSLECGDGGTVFN